MPHDLYLRPSADAYRTVRKYGCGYQQMAKEPLIDDGIEKFQRVYKRKFEK